jgi:hypothetical protein
MKIDLATPDNVVETSNTGMSTGFGIASNPTMFRILSSGLYSNKIAAVLREPGCNARDAHIVAGTARPIQVKLPSKLDRTFYIKDWGTGLSDAEVKSIYTVYGISTKQADERQTGGLGLGSKSPFAYTLTDTENPDGFTIEAVKEGVRRVYVAHLDNQGAPTVTEMGSFPADPDWQNGVCVSFPVQDDDMREFQDEARSIFKWFDQTPEFIGLSVPLRMPEFQFCGAGFKFGALGSSEDVRGATTPAVVMANVRYPIQQSSLKGIDETAEALLAAGIHLFVPNGAVNFAASREQLEYTVKTRTAIREQLQQATLEVAKMIHDRVMTPADTKLQWLRNVQQFVATIPDPIRRKAHLFLAQAGASQEVADEIFRLIKSSAMALPAWVGFETTTTGCTRVWRYAMRSTGKRNRRGVTRVEIRDGEYYDKRKNEWELEAFSVLGNVQVLYTDIAGADGRIRAMLREEGSDSETVVYLVAQVSSKSEWPLTKSYAERMCAKTALDGVPCKAVSSLPAVARSSSGSRSNGGQRSIDALTDGTEVTYIDGITGYMESIDISELTEPSEKFYLVRRRDQYGDISSGMTYLAAAFGRYYQASVIKALNTVLGSLGVSFEKVVVVEGLAQVRRLKLEANGFKPLLSFSIDLINKNWNKLEGLIDTRAVPDISCRASALKLKAVGLMAYHLSERSKAWVILEEKLKGHPLVDAAADLALMATHPGECPVHEALSTLQNRLEGYNRPIDHIERKSANPAATALMEKYPSMLMLDINQLAEELESDEPAKACTLLALTAAMDSPAWKAAQDKPELRLVA